jgi:hypothetical protein
MNTRTTFLIVGRGILKRKRKHSGFTLKLGGLDKPVKELSNGEIEEWTEKARQLVKQEENNKNIREIVSTTLIVREVEEDGDFITYMPFNDRKIEL